MPAIIRQKLTSILLGTLIAIFALTYLVVNFGMYRPAKAKFDEGAKTLKALKAEQAGKSELVAQIDEYRQGLYALSLLLDARQNVLSGSNPDNPFFVFDYYQVLQDLRRLLPPSARATQLQVNSKGLITIPLESTSYKALGYVLRLFKDSDLFTEVKIPAGAQIVLSTSQADNAAAQTDYGFNIPVAPPVPMYTLTLQATLNPDFWKNKIPFADVDPKASYANAIRDLYIAKAIEGYKTGDDYLFKPEQAINRAELLKIALFQSLRNDQIQYDEYQQYQDLSQEDWFYKAVQVASKMGIAEGDSTGRFHPEDTTNRLEALKMLLHIFNVSTDEPASSGESGETPKPLLNPFSDVGDKDDFYPLIRVGIRNGLFAKPNGEFKPNEPVTRAEVAYWTWKLMANEDSAKADANKTEQTR